MAFAPSCLGWNGLAVHPNTDCELRLTLPQLIGPTGKYHSSSSFRSVVHKDSTGNQRPRALGGLPILMMPFSSVNLCLMLASSSCPVSAFCQRYRRWSASGSGLPLWRPIVRLLSLGSAVRLPFFHDRFHSHMSALYHWSSKLWLGSQKRWPSNLSEMGT